MCTTLRSSWWNVMLWSPALLRAKAVANGRSNTEEMQVKLDETYDDP